MHSGYNIESRDEQSFLHRIKISKNSLLKKPGYCRYDNTYKTTVGDPEFLTSPIKENPRVIVQYDLTA